MIKNIDGTTLQPCSFHPVTGYQRKGYCYHSKEDAGKHLVCAKMDKRFLNYTKSKGNDLSRVVREGDNWCLCEDRYYQAYKAGKAPKVIRNATHSKVLKPIRNTIRRSVKGGKKTRKQTFLYHPDNPDKSFDVYIDKNPKDTIPIQYTTVTDVKKTIQKLEKLYKTGKYSHKRIWQVAMIMKVRLQAMLKHHKTRYPNAKHVKQRYQLAKHYLDFLSKRTKTDKKTRKKLIYHTLRL